MKNIFKILDHERGKILGPVAAVGLLLTLNGCGLFDVTTKSLTSGEMVNPNTFAAHVTAREAELNAMITSHNALVEAGWSDLEAKASKREAIIGTLSAGIPQLVAGVLNPTQLTGLAVNLGLLAFGGGAGLDHHRKNKKIAELKNGDSNG